MRDYQGKVHAHHKADRAAEECPGLLSRATPANEACGRGALWIFEAGAADSNKSIIHFSGARWGPVAATNSLAGVYSQHQRAISFFFFFSYFKAVRPMDSPPFQLSFFYYERCPRSNRLKFERRYVAWIFGNFFIQKRRGNTLKVIFFF